MKNKMVDGEKTMIEKLYSLLERAQQEGDPSAVSALRWAIFNLENDVCKSSQIEPFEEAPVMITIKEASDMTKLSYDYIRKLCISNKIVHIRAGAKILINKQKLSEYLNNGEVNRKVSTI